MSLSKSEEVVVKVLNRAKSETWGPYSMPITRALSVMHHDDPNVLVCQFTVNETHLNGLKTVHGGCYSTLVDMATSLALWKVDGNKLTTVTVDLSVSCIASSTVGDVLTVTSTVEKLGKALAYTNCKITKGDKVIATGSHTKFVLRPAL